MVQPADFAAISGQFNVAESTGQAAASAMSGSQDPSVQAAGSFLTTAFQVLGAALTQLAELTARMAEEAEKGDKGDPIQLKNDIDALTKRVDQSVLDIETLRQSHQP